MSSAIERVTDEQLCQRPGVIGPDHARPPLSSHWRIVTGIHRGERLPTIKSGGGNRPADRMRSSPQREQLRICARLSMDRSGSMRSAVVRRGSSGARDSSGCDWNACRSALARSTPFPLRIDVAQRVGNVLDGIFVEDASVAREGNGLDAPCSDVVLDAVKGFVQLPGDLPDGENRSPACSHGASPAWFQPRPRYALRRIPRSIR